MHENWWRWLPIILGSSVVWFCVNVLCASFRAYTSNRFEENNTFLNWFLFWFTRGEHFQKNGCFVGLYVDQPSPMGLFDIYVEYNTDVIKILTIELTHLAPCEIHCDKENNKAKLHACVSNYRHRLTVNFCLKVIYK